MTLPKITKEWALFLDRDGVINERIIDNYVKTPDEFQFISGSKEAIVIFTQHFGHLFVVTNQQGIGKGYMTTCNLSDVHTYMLNIIENEGGKIDAVYFAPQLEHEKSEYRKPNTGMGKLAQKEYPTVDFNKSIMVGDSDSDIEFGKNLGMITVKIGTKETSHEKADYYCNSLYDCIKLFNL
jgi:D-glycero-D-manno-heptose 1,7-bisphosphate phosphatase